jgi:hypothetical protein
LRQWYDDEGVASAGAGDGRLARFRELAALRLGAGALSAGVMLCAGAGWTTAGTAVAFVGVRDVLITGISGVLSAEQSPERVSVVGGRVTVLVTTGALLPGTGTSVTVTVCWG